MAPNIKDKDVGLSDEHSEFRATMAAHALPREYTIVYPMVLIMLYWHVGALYGVYLLLEAKWATVIFNLLASCLAGILGLSVGVHRLWSHRAFKAKLPLQIILMLCHCLCGQQSVIKWARDHRVHHKYCDTDADPHNATRGFFFCHIGWLLVKKHPDLIEKSKTIDISDLLNNPVLRFQKKYYPVLASLLVFILPTVIPVYFWQESWNAAYHLSLLRLVVTSNATFAINSVAHKFGSKPYDKDISSTQNEPLSLLTFGEGYHNFHHIFPYDYRVSELSSSCFKVSTFFINFFARIGWAYDLKYASDDMILKRAIRTGDGTHPKQVCGDGEGNDNIWGWGDEDMSEEDKEILYGQDNVKKSTFARNRHVGSSKQ